MADFWGLKLPHTHDVGLVGEEPTHTGLLAGEAQHEAKLLSRKHFFSPVKMVDEDRTQTTYLFGQEWMLFG